MRIAEESLVKAGIGEVTDNAFCTGELKTPVLLVKTDAQKVRTADRSIYLGPWCRDAHVGSGYSRVLPHHLDNLERVDELRDLTGSLFDHYLPQLAAILNKVHGVAWSDRAWKILIGPWLTVFLDVVIDRFETIRQLRTECPDAYTYATTFPPGTWVPSDFTEFTDWAVYSDQFNEYLLSKLLLESSETSGMVADIFPDTRASIQRKSALTVKRAIRVLLDGARPIVSNPVTFVDSYFTVTDQMALELKLGQIPNIFPIDICSPGRNVDSAMRERLDIQPGWPNPLNTAICGLLADLFPKAYLEEFTFYLNKAISHFPKKTKMIVTGHAYSFNEGFRFWAANQVDTGTKLVSVQHGGNYGTNPRVAPLQHEFRVVDYFCTAGWNSKEFSQTFPMPIPRIATAGKVFSSSKSGKVIWIWKSFRPFPFRLSEGSVKTDLNDYLEEQKRFGRALQDSIKREVKIRLYPPDGHWGVEAFVRREFPEMHIDDKSEPFKISANKSRLWVLTYNSTTLLEAMVANIPIVLFWNPAHCSNNLSEDAKSIFDELRRCGVYHESPDSAARMVSEVFPDTQRWWASDDIQRARRNFAEKFAMTRDSWLDVWADKLDDLLRQPSA